MQPGISERLLEVSGVIQRVAVPDREVTVLVEDRTMTFGLAPGCVLSLHGEPVKLRLLQARDRAHVLYTQAGERLAAHVVRVS